MKGHMLFDFATSPTRDQSKLLLSTVVPRPIAWIVSLDLRGQLNAAPFSFFNAFVLDPPVVGVGIGSRESGQPKDTRRNIRNTGELVINLVSEDMASGMNVTAIDFESGVNELSEAEVNTCPSIHIRSPRIAGSPVAMECELMQIVDLGPETGFVLGRVVAMHVREDVILDAERHYIDTPRLRLIARMHSGWYARTSDLLQMDRISRAGWGGSKEKLTRRRP
jgi:flavin reductase (DIM6/NTAB) family NADH-FMN oxidoreductase RutF